jgi:uridine phosphorylase
MSRIHESELILNSRGAVYHLDLLPAELADLVITVGDPWRVPSVSKHFDEIFHTSTHREFVTHSGRIGEKKISVVSTGIGTDNVDIVLNELDALVNIDFNTRTIRPHLRHLKIIRVGTAGSLQPDIPVDSYVVSTHGLGIDNLLNFYRHDHNEEEKQLLQSFVTQTQLHHHFAYPYISTASPSLLKHFVNGFNAGITVTCPGFYGPQGRILRLGLSHPDLINRMTQFQFGQHRIANFEMETSGIYGLSRIFGHHCLSLSVIVANRVKKEFSRNSALAIEQLISKTLEIVTASNF